MLELIRTTNSQFSYFPLLESEMVHRLNSQTFGKEKQNTQA